MRLAIDQARHRLDQGRPTREHVNLSPQLVASPESLEVLRSLVQLIEGVGYQVLTEGIETPDQAEAVRRAECGTAQGYLFGRPVPAHRLTLAVETAPSR